MSIMNKIINKTFQLENASAAVSQASLSLNANAPNFTPAYLATSVEAAKLSPEKIEMDHHQVPGKGNVKEEVVIRNADSGKG